MSEVAGIVTGIVHRNSLRTLILCNGHLLIKFMVARRNHVWNGGGYWLDLVHKSVSTIAVILEHVNHHHQLLLMTQFVLVCPARPIPPLLLAVLRFAQCIYMHAVGKGRYSNSWRPAIVIAQSDKWRD